MKSRRTRSEAPPAFVELLASPTAAVSEGLIELEGRRGKMRIQWKGTAAPDLGWAGPSVLGITVIQIVPQMKIWWLSRRWMEDLPVRVQGVSMRAQGLRLDRAEPPCTSR